MRIVSLLLLFGILCFDKQSHAQPQRVDFRYAPATHLTAICFPDDWLKTVVTEKGELAYDFGPGPYVKPLTTIRIGVLDQEVRVRRQYFENPRVPIAISEYAGEGVTIRQEAFALVPGEPSVAAQRTSQRVQRLNGLNGAVGWAAPEGVVDPAFRNVAWGVNRPIQYRISVAPGSTKQVALGICESYKPRAVMRILELRVDGAPWQTVDPMALGNRNQPYIFLFEGKDENRDGQLTVEVHAAPTSPDPNVFLNAFWIFPEKSSIDADQLMRGELSSQAEIYYDCGLEYEIAAPTTRIDALQAIVSGDDVTPVITVQTSRALVFDSTQGMLLWNGRPYLLSRPRARTATTDKGKWSLVLPRGTQHLEVAVVHGPQDSGTIHYVPDLKEARARARLYWEKKSGVPFDRIYVPDSDLQSLLEANIRNLYQIRERVDGRLQFQPGPSVYRGLWMHDILYAMEAAAFLGDLTSARTVVEEVMARQDSTGQIRVMSPHVMYRETPILIYMMCRYARLANDAEWLRKNWLRIVRGVAWIQRTRAETLADSNATYYGLMPPSFTDGGIHGVNAEYSSVYWSLIAARKAVEAAHWLGRDADARQWQAFYDEFFRSFRQAYARDRHVDAHRHYFLPIRVADTSKTEVPQRGQWAPLEALFRGGILKAEEELIAGTLAVLDDSLKQGLTVNTGWLQNGVWPFFDALRGAAQLWCGQHAEAVATLYAIANHASPYGTWVEEQLPKEIGTRTSGDASNASASAFFIDFLRRMFVLERDDQLELLAGVPPEWLKPGATIALRDLPTELGRVHLNTQLSNEGRAATIALTSERAAKSQNRIMLHLAAFKQNGFRMKSGQALPDTLQLDFGKAFTLELEN